MSDLERASGREAAERVRSGGWVQLSDGGSHLVVGARESLARSRAVWVGAGSVAGAGSVLVLAEFAVAAGWLCLVVAVVVGVLRLRTEVRARVLLRRRTRGRGSLALDGGVSG